MELLLDNFLRCLLVSEDSEVLVVHQDHLHPLALAPLPSLPSLPSGHPLAHLSPEVSLLRTDPLHILQPLLFILILPHLHMDLTPLDLMPLLMVLLQDTLLPTLLPLLTHHPLDLP